MPKHEPNTEPQEYLVSFKSGHYKSFKGWWIGDSVWGHFKTINGWVIHINKTEVEYIEHRPIPADPSGSEG